MHHPLRIPRPVSPATAPPGGVALPEAMPVLRNFIGGTAVDSKEGRTAPVVDPAPGRRTRRRRCPTEADVDAAMAVAQDAFEGWRDTTPGQRQLALLRFADAVEARGEEIVAAECRNTGKPIGLTRQEELAPIVDELRFFAGAARLLEGKSAGEYLARPHLAGSGASRSASARRWPRGTTRW